MAERYIKEYAAVCKRAIKNSDSMRENVKERANKRIDKAVKLRDSELITADEAIKMILERITE